MSRWKIFLTGSLGLLAVTLGLPVPVQAATEQASGVFGNIELKRGHFINVSFQKLANPEKDSWRYLQAFNLTLDELLTAAERSRIGCQTSVEEISCEQLWAAVGLGRPQHIENVRNVTFAIYRDDWNGLGGKASLREKFDQEKAIFEEQEGAEDGAARPTQVDLAVSGEVGFKEPACVPPYANPCYSRPACTMSGGCSKSLLSCKPCSY